MGHSRKTVWSASLAPADACSARDPASRFDATSPPGICVRGSRGRWHGEPHACALRGQLTLVGALVDHGAGHLNALVVEGVWTEGEAGMVDLLGGFLLGNSPHVGNGD